MKRVVGIYPLITLWQQTKEFGGDEEDIPQVHFTDNKTTPSHQLHINTYLISKMRPYLCVSEVFLPALLVPGTPLLLFRGGEKKTMVTFWVKYFPLILT